MDISIQELIPVVINVLILLFLSGVFSGAETAFTNLSPAKIEVIKEDGKFASELMYKLYQKLDLVITLSLILSNGVNILLATYLALFFSKLFGAELGGTVSATIGTILVIVFGEIIPKKIAILYSVWFSRYTSHLLNFLNYLIFPLLYPMQMINRLLDKLASKTKVENEHEEKVLLEEEIKATLGIGHLQGALEGKEYEMMQKLLLLNDKEVQSIMTHRSEIIAIEENKTLKDLVVLASENNVSRIPVFSESIENISSIISIPQLSSLILNPKNLNKPVKNFCTTKAFKIPESKILDDLFFEFQKKRVHMAIVLNEFGETSGLITLEDIVEQIFGEIEDETDEVETDIEMIGENVAKAEGDVSLEEIEELLNIEFPDIYTKHRTIGWLVLDILHRFPSEGEVILVPGTNIQLEVIDKDGEYIDKVYVTILNQDHNQDQVNDLKVE